MSGTARAVLLDRDDTICPDVPHNGDPAKMHVFPYAPAAVKRLNDAGYLVIVVTNQSGIGRGMYTVDDMVAVNEEMKSQLSRSGAVVDDIYYCPHLPDAGCSCRKPETGMGLRAIADHDLDPSRCWMVGDKDADVEFGRRLGMRSLKVGPGFTLGDAVDEILSSD